MTARTNSRHETVDLTDPAVFVNTDPYEFWRDIRRDSPVYWHDSPGPRPGFWVVAGYHDVRNAYQNAAALGSRRGTVLQVLLAGDDPAGDKMLAVTDPPRHRDLRAIMSKAFGPRTLHAVGRAVHQHAEQLVSNMTGTGPFDFATHIAEHIPMGTICDLLAIPAADRQDLLSWNKMALSTDDADAHRSREARNEIVFYFLELAQQRRENPGDDVVSMLSTAHIDGEQLSLDEIALNCYSIILGGDESSRMSAICGVKALTENPAQWHALRAGDVSIESAVEEILRWSTPAMHFARTANHDHTIGGHTIRASDIVTLWNISANNDETVFDRPRRFDPTRSPNRHLTFGHGRHFCIGSFLGRLELAALLNAMLKSVAELEMHGEPTRIYSNFLYGYSSLPVSFTSA